MADKVIAYILNAKKVVVYVLGIVAQVLALGFLPEDISKWGYVLLAVASGVGIYKARNTELDVPGSHAEA